MQNRRSRSANRRKSVNTSFSRSNKPDETSSEERRLKKLDRRVDSIQAAFVNMQN